MPSQRIILGIGLAILLVIGAASIGLDLMSRSDTASVDRALGILSKLSDMRPLLRRAESAARAFALSGDRQFASEYREASDAILPALAALIEAVKDNPTEKQLIEETKALVERQIAINGELIRLRIAGDSAAVAALVGQEDRAATAAIDGNLRQMNELDAKGDHDAFLETDKEFHTSLVRRYDNLILDSIMDRIRSHFAVFGLAAISHAGRVPEILCEHRAVIDALHGGNKSRAAAAMRDHLLITEKYVLGKV